MDVGPDGLPVSVPQGVGEQPGWVETSAGQAWPHPDSDSREISALFAPVASPAASP